MDAEHPTSPSHLLGRVAATLLALLLLYPLSVGPAVYLAVRLRKEHNELFRFYGPLNWAIEGTPLEQICRAYGVWWGNLARVQMEQ